MTKLFKILVIIYITVWCIIKSIIGMFMCISDILEFGTGVYWFKRLYIIVQSYIDSFDDWEFL